MGPDAQTAQDVVNLLDAGQGLVVLHHAISAWPGWEGWAEVTGARFLYRPGRLRGRGPPVVRLPRRPLHVRVTDPDHPIAQGVSDFEVDDELYFAPFLTDRLTPFLDNDADMDGALFQDTFDEVSNGTSTGVTCAGPRAGRRPARRQPAHGLDDDGRQQPGRHAPHGRRAEHLRATRCSAGCSATPWSGPAAMRRTRPRRRTRSRSPSPSTREWPLRAREWRRAGHSPARLAARVVRLAAASCRARGERHRDDQGHAVEQLR